MDTNNAVIILSSLSQETRLEIIRLLMQCGADGMPAGELGEELGVAHNTLSFHLAQLTHAGLVTSRRKGRSILYAANYKTMDGLMAFLTDNCCARSDKEPADCMPSVGKKTASTAKKKKKASSSCC